MRYAGIRCSEHNPRRFRQSHAKCLINVARGAVRSNYRKTVLLVAA